MCSVYAGVQFVYFGMLEWVWLRVPVWVWVWVWVWDTSVLLVAHC